MTIKSNTPEYLRTWADEISSRASRVRNLIGSSHWPSDGAYKEFLIREILTRHLPSYLNLARGFIRPVHRSEACSPEIDLLLTDPTIHVPLFYEGDLQIVVPSAVLGTIEVKSTYAPAALAKALENIAKTRITLAGDIDSDSVWSAALFAAAGEEFSSNRFLDTLSGQIGALDDTIQSELRPGVHTALLLPNSVAISNGALAMIRPIDSNPNRLQIRVFDSPDLALALALAQIFAHVQSMTRRDQRVSELDDLLTNFDAASAVTSRELALKELRP